MVKAVVLYGHPENPDAFERHYAETHTPLAEAIPGLRRFEAARGLATPDGTAVPYQRIAELTFDDMDALQGGWARARERPRDDLQNFASGVCDLLRRDRLRAPRSHAPGVGRAL